MFGCRQPERSRCRKNVMPMFSVARRGFTLIELLVVIAIISLIISILLPSLRHAKELARETVCTSNARNIGVVMQYYAEDNDRTYPIPYDWQNQSPYRFWSVAISGYITEDQSVLNPRGYMITTDQPESLVKHFQCPTLVGVHPTERSTYVMNNYALGIPESFADGLNLELVSTPYNLIAVGEGAYSYKVGEAKYQETFLSSGSLGFYHAGGEITGTWKEWFFGPEYEQTDGRGTLLMVDGHVLSAVMDDIPDKYQTAPF